MPTPTIDSPRLRQLRGEEPNLKIIDVRTGSEFETSHIPGSHNVPLPTLAEHAADLAAVDHPVVLVCESGSRAANARSTLDDAGKIGLYVLDGGMSAWRATGGEVTTGSSDNWAMDRQVRLVAGSLVLGGVLASVVSPKAKWLSAGVGGGLAYSAVSNTCVMASVLGRLPYNRGAGCDIGAVLAELSTTSPATSATASQGG